MDLATHQTRAVWVGFESVKQITGQVWIQSMGLEPGPGCITDLRRPVLQYLLI